MIVTRILCTQHSNASSIFVTAANVILSLVMYLFAFAILALAASAAAKRCTNMTVPVTISARQGIFDIAVPQTSTEATDFVRNVTQQGRNFTEIVLTGYNTTTGTYNISTQFCVPTTGNSTNATNPTVQVLTHGIGFDKTYVLNTYLLESGSK